MLTEIKKWLPYSMEMIAVPVSAAQQSELLSEQQYTLPPFSKNPLGIILVLGLFQLSPV